ncbi:MAG: ABC transporter permease [Acidobacteriia bacterium]|nr:ABC transporter permease [Terriglobia bacterium]
MPRTFVIVVAFVLVLHGLIHLMGTAVYTKMATIEGLKYKTTLLGGRWDLGESGIRVFGALWAVAAVGFVVAAVALMAGWGWWQLMLVGVGVFSLVLTVLDWSNAFAGAIINIAILAAVLLGPRVVHWFSN